MRARLLFFLSVLLCAVSAFAQIATKTGSIYGKVVNEQGTPQSGVNVQLESQVVPSQFFSTGSSGSFRFANLPPGNYSITARMEGFTEVRQEDIHVSTGSNMELAIRITPSLSQELIIKGEAPLIDTARTGITSTFTREILDEIPMGRDPWFVLNMTPGVDSTRFNTGSESGHQSVFFARGGKYQDNVWNYDGVNHTDAHLGGSPTYYDFDALEEIQISTAGNDVSIQTGGVAINLVTKRAGNQWEGDASFYFTNEGLQSTNTPTELLANPILDPVTGEPAGDSNRIDVNYDFGFSAGGPIVRDHLFLWGAYRKNEITLFNVNNTQDQTALTDYNAKLNLNWNSKNETQLGYFKGLRNKQNWYAIDPTIQAQETAATLENKPLQGIWTAQHTWTPNDKAILSFRYGYIGEGVKFFPVGGVDQPIIYLADIPRYESTFFHVEEEQPAHDIVADVNYFKDDLLGGDHDFRFGFEYKATHLAVFSSYGNGVYIIDDHQTVPGGPLTEGLAIAQHYLTGRADFKRASFYAADTFRKDRLTLNIGFRFDHQTGKNKPSNVPAVPGFEQFVAAFSYPGMDPGIAFNNVSPRVGATYDLNGDGKTVIRTNLARYYSAFDPLFVQFSNPAFVYNGVTFQYKNVNGDRTISPDELVGEANYFGGLTQPVLDLDEFLALNRYDPDLSNAFNDEFLLGIEQELSPDLSVSGTFVYRRYANLLARNPLGVSTDDYVPGGIFDEDTPLGHFTVPYFVLGFEQDDSTILTNIKDYTQSYKGLDIMVRKRMSRNFQFGVGLNIQRQAGHYDSSKGLAFQIASQTLPFDPTNLPFVGNQAYAYRGGNLIAAVTPYSEWSLKVAGAYQFPWNIQVGTYLRYQQGYPFILFGEVPDEFGGHRILVEPVGSRWYDDVFTIDAKMEKGIDLGDAGRLTAILDIFNLTNESTVVNRAFFFPRPNFNRIIEVLSPRAFRLGVRYSF